ncbi:transposase [Novosphingobium sp. AAP83]|uniref:transposase n=1 Tax=Novosphingobium sp. AAP83 TaxID=1523425 RepID=UPI0009EB5014
MPGGFAEAFLPAGSGRCAVCRSVAPARCCGLHGKVRTAVERTFSEIKCGPHGFIRMRYRGLERCRLHADLAAIAYNLRRAAG